MRKTILTLTLAAALPLAGATAIGCGSTWWAQFQNDPVLQVQTFEQGVQVVLNDAQVAWTFVVPFLPQASATQITQQFNNAVYAVNHALQVLNDAVNAALAIKAPTVDFSALMSAVTDAVAQVLAIIDQYTQTPVAEAGAPATAATSGKAPMSPALADAHAILGNLKKQYGKAH